MAGCDGAGKGAPDSGVCRQLPSLEYSKALRLDTLYGENVAEIRSIVGRDTLVKRFVLRGSQDKAVDAPLHRCLEGAVILRSPIERIVALSSSHIGYLLRLEAADRIVAVGEGKYIADTALYNRAAGGDSGNGKPAVLPSRPDSTQTNPPSIEEVGYGNAMNFEKLVALNPDLIMTFATGGSQDDYERLTALRLPLMLTSEWQEDSPLAKAEWIKLYGMLLGGEFVRNADSIYQDERDRYKRLQAKNVATQTDRAGCGPRVLAGMSYGGVWYAPGGNSYTARLIKDAGGCYLWAADTTRELQLTLEDIFALADSADVWINPGMFGSPEEILAAEPRTAQIRAFREKRVYQNDGHKGPGGGNDFFESAVAMPAELVQNLESLLRLTPAVAVQPQDSAKMPVYAGPTYKWYRNIF